MKKNQFSEDKIYHVYNRGVEKRKIFVDDKDYFRFIHDLFEFNNENPAFNVNYFFDAVYTGVRTKYLKEGVYEQKRQSRKLLVDIMMFTLMPNHYHLMLKPRKDDGIVRFMQKLGTGYTNYFNKKYDRVGPLCQGKYKIVMLEDHAHFLHLPFYIHSNPVELQTYGSSTSIGLEAQMDFLRKYRWSSFLDYIGRKNFPSVTQREFLLDFWGGEEKYEKEMSDWLKGRKRNMQKVKEVTLE